LDTLDHHCLLHRVMTAFELCSTITSITLSLLPCMVK